MSDNHMPIYDGTTDFLSFMKKWNSFANSRKIPKSKGKGLFRSALRGFALKIYDNVPADVMDGPWTSFLEYMQEELYPQWRRDAAQHELVDIQQKKEETVSEFFDRCETLALVAHPGNRYQTQREQSMKISFVHGLHSSIKRNLLRAETKHSYEALQMAKKEECIWLTHTSESTQSIVPTSTDKLSIPSTNRKTAAMHSILFLTCILLQVSTSMADDDWVKIEPMEFVDCKSLLPGYTYISPPTPSNCSIDPINQYTQRQAVMMMMNQTMHQIPAIKCKIETFKRCTDSKMFFSSYTDSPMEVQKPSLADCLNAIQTGLWNNKSFIPSVTVPNAIYTEKMGTFPGVHFWGETCNVASRLVMESGFVGETDSTGAIFSTLMNVEHCHIANGKCETDQALLLWNITERRKPCDFINLGLFNVSVGDNILIVGEQQNAYYLDRELQPEHAKECFPPNDTFSSGSTLFFIFDYTLLPQYENDNPDNSSSTIPQHDSLDSSVSTSQNIDFADNTSDTVNASAQAEHIERDASNLAQSSTPTLQIATSNITEEYFPQENSLHTAPSNASSSKWNQEHVDVGSTHHLSRAAVHVQAIEESQQMENNNNNLNWRMMYSNTIAEIEARRNFEKLVKALCHSRNLNLNTWRMSLDLKDPTPALRMLLQRDDIKGTSVGRNVFKIEQCRKILITKIKEDQTSGSTCKSTVLGMAENNITYNINPQLVDVQMDPNEVPCETLARFVFKNSDGLWMKNGVPQTVVNLAHSPHLPQFESRQLILSGPNIQANYTTSSFASMIAISFGASIHALQYQQTRMATNSTRPDVANDPLAELAMEALNGGKLFIQEGFETWKYWTRPDIWIVGLLCIVLGAVGIVVLICYFRAKGGLLVHNTEVTDDEPDEKMKMKKMKKTKGKAAKKKQQDSNDDFDEWIELP